MDRPFRAYEGDEPYVFVCYSHEDRGAVYPELTRLKASGLNIWYDEGIAPGSEWSETLAARIEGCTTFLYFVSPSAARSGHCRREVNYALEQPCGMVAVHLERTELSSGLKLTLSNRQAILKYDEPQDAYETKLANAIRAGRSAAADDSPDSRLRVGDWILDVGRRQLMRGGESRTLDPKAQSVLLHLVDRAPEVVSREGLLNRSWPGVIVGDNVLDQAVAQLRRAFGDNARSPSYIETLPKQGYRLVAAVESLERDRLGDSTRDSAAFAEDIAPSLGHRSWLLAAAVLVLILIAGSWMWMDPDSEEQFDLAIHIEKLGVRGSNELDGVAFGIRDELVRRLSQRAVFDVRTEARSPSAPFRLAGSVTPLDERQLLVSMTLTLDGRVIWSQSYEVPAHDRIRNQVAVGTRAASAISGIVLLAPGLDTDNPNARVAYLQGVARMRWSAVGSSQETIRGLFHRARLLDPGFASAYVMEAWTYRSETNAMVDGSSGQTAHSTIKDLIEQALAMEPDHWLALSLLADTYLYELNWTAAETAAQRSLILAPQPPMSVVDYLSLCGRLEEALPLLEQIIAVFPLQSIYKAERAKLLHWAGRDAEGHEQLLRILAEDPDNPRANQLYGMYLEAEGLIEEAAKAYGRPEDLPKVRTLQEMGEEYLSFANVSEGNPAKAWRLYVMAYTKLAQPAEAVKWLEAGWDLGDRWEVFAMRMYRFPGFEEMRATTEYQSFVERKIGRSETCPGYFAGSAFR